jgi:cysteine desulfurase / selenocysteine lyase
MLGPEGAGIFYCRQELLAKTRPLIVGWMNVINADEYGSYDFTLKSDARKFECGSYNVPGFLALRASVDLLLAAGIDAIAERMRVLTDRLIAGLQRRGYSIVSPRDEGEWSGIVSFVSSKYDHQEIFRRLRSEHQTEIAVREKRLRVSAHFYNTEEQIDRLIEHLPAH